MSEEKPTEPTEPALAPSQETATPPESTGLPWTPPPPSPPAGSLWHRIAAAVVLAAVVAASAGAGIGWSLARALEAPRSAAVATPSEAPIQPQPESSGSVNSSTAAAKVIPAVVDINTTVAGGGSAAGTGMIVSSSGEVLTNDHVVRGSTSITVSIQGRSRTYSAHVIAVDQSQDVALIKIDGVSRLPTVTFGDSTSLQVGDSVSAIGNALGRGGSPRVTEGNITGLDQTITATEGRSSSETLTGMIQSDAAISPGDSGGPLVNSSGQVVGMITAGQAGFNSSASRVGFAIASNTALKVVNRIRAHEQAADLIYGQIGYMGVSAQTLTSTTAAQLGLNVSSGALVVGVQPGSPAEAAGITQGSAITSVGGSAVTSTTTLGNAIKAHKPGDKVAVTWVTKTGTHTGTLTLAGVNP